MSDDVDRLNPALTAAVKYTRRGWSVIPVPFRGKNPGRDGWQRLRLREVDLPERFSEGPKNVGVLLGEPSKWLIDVDVDHPLALAMADDLLPPTPAVFGRVGNPRSHRIYWVTGPIATRQFKSKSAGTIIELRSTGAQTVFPPSIHESGEAIEWDDPDAEPTCLEPDELLAAVELIAGRVKVELGEKRPPRPQKKKAIGATRETSRAESIAEVATLSATPLLPEARRAICLRGLLRMTQQDHRDGSMRLFVCACRCVEYDLDDEASLAVIADYARERPFAKAWTEEEILRRIRDAEKRVQRGAALAVDTEGLVPLGQRDSVTGKLVLSSRRTLPTAEAYIHEFAAHPEGRTLQNYSGQLVEWRGNAYREIEENALKQRLQRWLHDSLRYVTNRETGVLELAPFESNPGTINSAFETLCAYTHLPASVSSPCWLDSRRDDLPPVEILSCLSFLLHLPTRQRIAATPRFFTHNALDFDPDETATVPIAWLTFLHQLFDGDVQALELLQEWFGLCLVGETKYQKMLLIVGPRRSGKGTLARVLARLVGLANVCAPTTSALAGPFGLQPLIGKSLAIVSDARFHGDNITTVVERLLCISGEDTLTVDRKHMTSVTLKLATRFLFLSNELPTLHEASSALAGRFLILRLTESFYGREDLGLTDRLLAELPAILNWAIEGWQRLYARCHFVMPESSQEAVEELEQLSSPVLAFVRDRCVVGAAHRVDCNVLFAAWQGWCRDEGSHAAGTKQSFGRNLAAAIAGLTSRRGTGNVRFYQGVGLREGGG